MKGRPERPLLVAGQGCARRASMDAGSGVGGRSCENSVKINASRFRRGERWSDPTAGARTDVAGIGSGVKRLLTLRHEERKLAAVMPVTSATPRQATVVLKPWGTLTGRLLDGRGSLGNRVLDGLPEYVVTGKDGRFRIERLPPEHAYQIRLGQDEITEGTFPRPVTVKPGETLDLGDVVVKRAGE
jgi:hypothetical protein